MPSYSWYFFLLTGISSFKTVFSENFVVAFVEVSFGILLLGMVSSCHIANAKQFFCFMWKRVLISALAAGSTQNHRNSALCTENDRYFLSF